MKIKPQSAWACYLLLVPLMVIMLVVHSRETGAASNLLEAGMSSGDDNLLSSIRWSAIFSDAASLIDVIQTSDGRFVVAGYSNSENGFLAKLEQDGTILWQKSYSDAEFDESRIRAIGELSDNNIVAVGEYYLSSGGTNAFVSKFNPNGDVIWQLELGGGGKVADDVIPIESGHFLIVGWDLGEISDGWVALIDAAGSVLWQKRYGDPSVNRFHGGIRTSDGNIVLVGITWKTFSYQSADAWLMRINPDGDVLWQKTYDNYWADYFGDIVETGDGELAVSGGTNSAFATTYPWALKFSQDGNIIWQREWPDDNVNHFSSVTEADNGRLVFLGQRSPNLIRRAWLVSVDENTGTPLWEKLYGTTTDQDYVHKIISAGDGGFLVVGYTESFGINFRHGWILKVAGDGAIPGCSLVSATSTPSNPTTVTIASTTFIPQNTAYVPTAETTNVQTFSNPLDNQCYYLINFTDFSYLPTMFSH